MTRAEMKERAKQLRTTLPFGLAGLATDTTFLTGVRDGRGRYISQLAAYPGDPKAYFTSRADIRRVCEQKGYSCDGAVKVKARSIDAPDPLAGPYQVADDIVQDGVNKRLAGETVSPRERADLEDTIRKRFSGRE